MAKRKMQLATVKRVNKLLDRMEAAAALELYADGDQDCLDLAKLLRSLRPEDKQCNISTLATRIGMPMNRVVMIYKEMKRAESVIAVAQRLPAITTGIAIDAESKDVVCLTCKGEGQIVIAKDADGLPTETKECLPCGGTGFTYQPGCPVARKQVLEMMNMTGNHAIPINAPGSQFVIASGESLEQTLRSARSNRNGGSNGIDRNAGRLEEDQRITGEVGEGVGERSVVVDGDRDGSLR